jgi:hypothetical protein
VIDARAGGRACAATALAFAMNSAKVHDAGGLTGAGELLDAAAVPDADGLTDAGGADCGTLYADSASADWGSLTGFDARAPHPATITETRTHTPSRTKAPFVCPLTTQNYC